MTASYNRVQLIGFLGEDPVRREFQQGGAVVSFSLATHEHWKDAQSGERRQATEWHRVAIFNEALGKVAVSYLRKGSAVLIEGQLRTRKYKDRDQVERKVTEIVLAKGRGELKLMDARQDDAARQEASGRDRAAGDGAGGGPGLDEDYVPF